MRSVTFADPAVVDLLNRSFVVLWDNHAERIRRGGKGVEQPAWSKEELERYPEGGGGTNVVSIVAAPDGRIVNQLQGWFRPERLADELDFSLTLLDGGGVAARQAERGNAIRARAERLARENPGEMLKPFPDSAIRRTHAALNLLADVHMACGPLLGRAASDYLDEIESRGKVIS